MPPHTEPSNEPVSQHDAIREQLYARIGEVSSLPTLAMQIFEVASDPNTDADDLVRLVEGDPALAARIVRTANSALYGLRRRVNDLMSCIMLIGFKEVRNLALTVYVAKLFRESQGHAGYTRLGLWQHLVCTGSIARFLCKRLRRGPAEDAYLAGLLHDLGIILMDQYMHQRFCSVLDRLTESADVLELERECFGFDHTELGAEIAQRWRFPESLCDSIRFHHAPESYTGEHRELVSGVAVANYICNLKGISSLGVASARRPDDGVFEALGIVPDELALLWEEIDAIISAVQATEMV